MKKLLLFALCAATIGSAGAQKANVDAAKKLAGKIDKIEDARNSIKQALQDASTQNDWNTYNVASEIELKAYDKARKDLGVAGNGENADALAAMDQYLLNAYPYILKIAETGSADAKNGKKALKEAQNKLSKYYNDFFQAGADLYSQKKYPQAFEAFYYNGEIPELNFMQGVMNVPDTIRATSYFNAGLSGWAADDLKNAARAFRKAMDNNYDKPEAYIYGLACWQNLMNRDSTLIAQAQKEIYDISSLGNAKFGMQQPVFLNNMVNVLVEQNKDDEAITLLNKLISENPTSAGLYGSLGYVYDRMEKNDLSEQSYRKAVQMADANYETLLNAAKKIFRIGTEKWNTLEGNTPDVRAQRDAVKNDYFQFAKGLVAKARELDQSGQGNIDYLEEQINYALESLK